MASTSDTISQSSTKPRLRGCLFFIKRGLLAVVVLFIFGFIYQLAATELDRRSYQPPGQLLAVDGHMMHIHCTGEGQPTVILEAAGGHFSATWALVQVEIATVTRVCAYDRAGYGWSDPAPQPRDAAQIAIDLHTLLEEAGIEPPYIMVGHSVGGLYSRVYNSQFTGEVTGLVLVDATHPDNWTRQGESIQTLQTMASVSAVLSRFGLMRLFFGGENFGLPAEANAALKADIFSSQYWDTQQADTTAMLTSLDQGRAAGVLGDLPLAVLAALTYPEGAGRDTEYTLQQELAALSSNSRFQNVEGAGHITLVTDPQYAQVVSDEILKVIEAARTGELLAQ
jgi:pimeloyl-ACP methyl ester carboxylesterase